jgi:flagellar hook protein FlgE
MIERELSNVELEEEMTQLIMTQRCYEANLKAAKTKDEMLGTLVDIMS